MRGMAARAGWGIPRLTRIAVRIARMLFALAVIYYGLGHFVFFKETISGVPAWLPWHAAWVYFTGCAFIAAGLAIFTGVCARLASALSAVQIGLFVLLVWMPVVLVSGPKSRFQWSETIISAALTAAAWVVADSYRGIPWLAVKAGWAEVFVLFHQSFDSQTGKFFVKQPSMYPKPPSGV